MAQIPIGRKRVALDLSDSIAKEIERPPGRDRRVELLERTGGGITWIGEEGLAGFCPSVVEAAESRLGQKDFPADFEPPRNRMRGLGEEGQGNGAHGFEIGRDVFTRDSVPTCRAHGQFPVFIHQLDGDAVDFWLSHVFNVLRCFERALDTLMKFLHLRSGDDVGQRQHWYGVADLGKRCQRRGADLPGGGGRVVQFGIRGFQVNQAPKELVVFGVADEWLVKDVVAMVMQR